MHDDDRNKKEMHAASCTLISDARIHFRPAINRLCKVFVLARRSLLRTAYAYNHII